MANPNITSNAGDASTPGSYVKVMTDVQAGVYGSNPTVELHCGTGKVDVTLTGLPPIMTVSFKLNCLTQEGANDDRPMLHLNHAGLPALTSGDPVYGYGGLQLSGGGQVVMGLATRNAPISSILANGATDTTFVCVSTGLGLDGKALGGITAPGNIQPGLTILNSKNTRVGGRKPRTDCVFSGSGTCHISAADGSLVADIQVPGLMGSNSDTLTILRSRFGMDWLGTTAVRNTFDGCKLDKVRNILIGGRLPGGGGADPAVRCSFGGNLFYGLEISHFISDGARVFGCEAGFGADGQTPIPNQRSNYIFFNTGGWFFEYCLSGFSIRNGFNNDSSSPGNPDLPTNDDNSKGWGRRGRMFKSVFGLCRDMVTAAPNKLSNILLTQCPEILVDQCVLCYGLQDGILVEGRPTTNAFALYPTVIPRWNVIRGCLIGVRPDGTPAGHSRHGIFVNLGAYTRIGDSGLPNGINTIKYNLGTSITCRKNFYDTNIYDVAGNVISGNGTDTPLLAF